MSNLTRREFLKTTSMAALAFAATGLLVDNKVSAADNCSVKTRYGTFNGFVDNQGKASKLGWAFRLLNRPSANFVGALPNR